MNLVFSFCSNPTKSEQTKKKNYQLIASWMHLSNWQIAKKVNLSIRSIQRYKNHIRDFLNKKTDAIQIVSKNRLNKNAIKKNLNLTVDNFMEKYTEYIKNRTNGIKNVNDATIKSFWKEIRVGDYFHEGYEKQISYQTLVNRLTNLGFLTIFSHKKTRRKVRKMIKIAELLKVQIEEVRNNYQNFIGLFSEVRLRVRLCRKENMHFGDELQIDACIHEWFDGTKSAYYHAIDVATGMVLASRFEPTETKLGYMRLLEDVFKKYGYPKVIRTDKRKEFFVSENTTTPLTKALMEKGIKVESSSSATFKAQVERSFKTAQANYLPILNGKNLEESNEITNDLNNYFNEKLRKNIEVKENHFGKVINGDYKIVERFIRTVTANTIQYDYKYYYPYNPENGKRVFLNDRSKVYVLIDKDGSIYIDILGIGKFPTKTLTREELNEYQLFVHNLGVTESTISSLLYTKIKSTNSFYNLIESKIEKLKNLLLTLNLDKNKLESEIKDFTHNICKINKKIGELIQF